MSGQRLPAQATHGTTLMDRRIRHITTIQVHNLTPFPARDSLASALSQPAEQSQFTSHGHLSDDLDVVMHRKRSRRISTNSHRSILSEDGSRNEGSSVPGVVSEGGRRTSGSRVNLPEESDHRQNPASGLAPTVRPHRARTNSMASSIRSHISGPSNSIPLLYGSSTSALTSSFLFLDNSQAELEDVIESRLVETFITITVPESPPMNDLSPSVILPLPSSFAFRDKAVPLNVEASSARKPIKVPVTSPSDKSKFRRESVPLSRSPSRLPLSHAKSASVSVTRVNGDPKRVPSRPAAEFSTRIPSSKDAVPTPHYFSPIHRPSTHPRFVIDARSNLDFAEGTDCSGSRLKIEVWGKVASRLNPKTSGKGKEKTVEAPGSEAEWKILQERDFDLNDLVPLPDFPDVISSRLPLNSLVIALSPPGGTFYLPPPASSPQRSPSPADGYASDPEPDVRNTKESGNFSSVSETLDGPGESPVPSLRRQYRSGPLITQDEAPTTTAEWQDLFKLVTLQSCIRDNQSSLLQVVQGLDKVLGSDSTLAQHREVFEYEARLQELATNHKKVIKDSNNLRSQIQTRLKNFHQRKQMLKLAQGKLEQDVESVSDLTSEVLRYQAQQISLRARFVPTRTTLIGILSSIYPIELLSPPDLLYTILDVPLPIPLLPSDPAPPLTLPSHKEINEETVATALGYAAQVVQLLSAYLGKSLVYPVTCIGSRSLIRDNISAMVGPRMFPLYSKGVDTYRFEYGVFLLNKNLELLMTERELRALDMRHTLPNLKNLLLTLTDGEGARLKQSRPPDSPISLASELELSSRPESPVDPDSTTPKASHATVQEGSTPSASRSSTPTTANVVDSSKKPLSFIAFSPLTDLLRGRYPSSSRISVKSRPGAQEPQSEELSVSENNSDEEDRKTISGTSRGADEGRKVDPPVNLGVEKLSEDSHSTVHSTPPSSVTPLR